MTKDKIRERLIGLIEGAYFCAIEELADHLIANGVTIEDKGWCGYCAVALEWGNTCYVKRTAMDRWTLMGKKLKFCPMCGRKLPEPPKGVEE